MSDWIDDAVTDWLSGKRRSLPQAVHNAINARYPGLTWKRCPNCDEPIDDAQTMCRDCEEAASE